MLSKQLRQIALTACISVVCFRKVRFTATAVAAQTYGAVSHDTIQRFLAQERARWSRQLWKRVKKFFKYRMGGYLIIDDTVICKDDSAWKTEMTSKLWSSAEKRYLYGQSVVLLIWTDGKTRILLDVRFKVKGSTKTKFDLALEMLRSAKDRKIAPDAVLFDSWYAAAKFMTAIRKLGWHWVCKLTSNRKLNGETPVKRRWKTTFGSCRATLAGGIEALIVKDRKAFFATSQVTWTSKQVKKAYRKRWLIEEVIKLLKSEFGFETCQARTIPAIQGHAYVCLMSFNTLELFRVKHNLSTLYHIRSVLFNQPIPLQDAWNLNPSIFA
jgi:putative transposase